MRENSHQATMKLRLHTQVAPIRYRHEVSGHEKLLKPIPNLECAQGMVVFVSVVIETVQNVRYSLRCADFNRLRHQGVCGPLIEMPGCGSQVEDRRDSTAINEV